MCMDRLRNISGGSGKVFCSMALFVIITSCSPMKQYRGHNYFNGSKFYNDTLNLSANFAGDIKFNELKRNCIRKKIKNNKGLQYRDLLFHGKAVMEPQYDVMFFYKKENNPSNETKTELIFNDTIKQEILYKKSLKDKAVFLYIKAIGTHNGNISILADANTFINSVKFDTSLKDELIFRCVQQL